jgi:branched-chain amino acid transport system ATP-binding protein
VSASLLSIQGVTKRFGGLVAVNDVSFDIDAGNIVSLIGPNGAGKTTLFNILTGQLVSSAGKIIFEGRNIGALKPNERAQLGFGRTFQISQTLTSLTVLENAMIGAFLHTKSLHLAAEIAHEALKKVGLGARENLRAGTLTLGERRRLEVARALAMEPRVLFLDEVMAGLNQAEVNDIVNLVLGLNAAGQTIIVIEHNLKVVRSFSKRVLVLNRGSILAQGTAEDVLSDPLVIEAYIGKSKK